MFSTRSKKPKKLSKKIAGFSLIEISVVIVIIGIVISGIFLSDVIVKNSRISSAQSLTISSPINGIEGSAIWLESSLDKSFIPSESADKNPITAWYDIRQSATKVNATQVSGANTPKYSNTINYIQAVKFDDTTGSYLDISDASFLNNTDYTIFILEQRASNKTNNYFIGDNTNANEATNNQNLTLGYSLDGAIKHSQGGTNFYISSVSSYSDSGNKPRVFTFVQDSISGKKTYINGLLAAQSADTATLSNITSLRIGNGYNGQIGEIVMFSRTLTIKERQSIENYLSKKWTTPLIKNISSCANGIVTNTGCQAACPVSITGVSTTIVADGSGSLTCDMPNFNTTPTIPYTCSSGTLNASGSCSCASGYSLNGTVCELPQTCTGGTIDTTSVPGSNIHIFTSSGTLTCPTAKTAQVLVVAGGGAAGESRLARPGGGGGGGGVLYQNSYALSATTYAVTVGAGGNPPNSVTNGGNSSFGVLQATGGGYGGARYYGANSGGSGGGGGGIGGQPGASGVSGQGYAGGSNQTTSGDQNAHCYFPSAGGGGSGGVGGNSSDNVVGVGGPGTLNQITGSSLYYGGGGSGGYMDPIMSCANLPDPATSTGGGGTRLSKNGQANTGGGGSGYGYGGAGGSGIVIVRYVN